MKIKVRKWSEKEFDIDRTIDGLGMHLDCGIRLLVISLNLNGIATEASCFGHIDSSRMRFPWVKCKHLTQARLSLLLSDFKEANSCKMMSIGSIFDSRKKTRKPILEVSEDLEEKLAATLSQDQLAIKILQAQSEFFDFGMFLANRFFCGSPKKSLSHGLR